MAFAPTDQAGFLDLWRRLFPVDYTDSLEREASGRGLDIAAAQAAIFARVSRALNVTTQAYYVRDHSTETADPATGATRATGTVMVGRGAPANFAITIAAGMRMQAVMLGTRGQELVLGEVAVSADVVIPAGGSVGTQYAVPVTAVLSGYQGNFPANRVQRFSPRGRATVLGTVVTDPSSPPAPWVLRDTRASAQRGGDAFTVAQIGQYVRLVGLASGVTTPRRILSVTPGNPNTAIIDPPLLAADNGQTPTIEVEEFADIGLTILSQAALTGGRDGELEAAAADRGLGRAPGESDPALRERVTYLDDVVSPNAIRRLLNRSLLPQGIRYRLLEVRDMDTLRGFFMDLDAMDFGSTAPIPKVVGSVLVGDGAVLLDRFVRLFVVMVSPGSGGEFGAGFDSPIVPNTNAWDWAFPDGYPVGYNAVIAGLYQQLLEIRAGGVAFVILRDPTL